MTHNNAKMCLVLRNIQEGAIIVHILIFRQGKTIIRGLNVCDT